MGHLRARVRACGGYAAVAARRGLAGNVRRAKRAARPTGRPAAGAACCASSEDEGADAPSQYKKHPDGRAQNKLSPQLVDIHAGFDVEQPPGLKVRHGPTEIEALDLVAAQIADQLGLFELFF